MANASAGGRSRGRRDASKPLFVCNLVPEIVALLHSSELEETGWMASGLGVEPCLQDLPSMHVVSADRPLLFSSKHSSFLTKRTDCTACRVIGKYMES